MIKALSPEEQGAAAPITLESIAASCKSLRREHDAALGVIDEYEAERLALEKRFQPRLIRAAERIKIAGSEVLGQVASAHGLFAGAKKTETFFGIRVGWMKGKGVVRFEDESAVIAKAERVLGDEAAGVVKTTKKLVKKALSALPGDVLRKLGVELIQTDDEPYLKPVESDASKRLSALLSGGEEDDEG